MVLPLIAGAVAAEELLATAATAVVAAMARKTASDSFIAMNKSSASAPASAPAAAQPCPAKSRVSEIDDQIKQLDKDHSELKQDYANEKQFYDAAPPSDRQGSGESLQHKERLIKQNREEANKLRNERAKILKGAGNSKPQTPISEAAKNPAAPSKASPAKPSTPLKQPAKPPSSGQNVKSPATTKPPAVANPAAAVKPPASPSASEFPETQTGPGPDPEGARIIDLNELGKLPGSGK
jgi:hypothetical protein